MNRGRSVGAARGVIVCAIVCAACGSRGEPASTPEPVEPSQASTSESSAEPAAEPEAVPEGSSLVRLFWQNRERDCPPMANGDCASSVELLGDGTLRVDEWGRPGAGPSEARASADAVERVAGALSDAAFLAQLDAQPACPDANDTERFSVELRDGVHEADTGYCNGEPVLAARGAIHELVSASLPDARLITPPF